MPFFSLLMEGHGILFFNTPSPNVHLPFSVISLYDPCQGFYVKCMHKNTIIPSRYLFFLVFFRVLWHERKPNFLELLQTSSLSPLPFLSHPCWHVWYSSTLRWTVVDDIYSGWILPPSLLPTYAYICICVYICISKDTNTHTHTHIHIIN